MRCSPAWPRPGGDSTGAPPENLAALRLSGGAPQPAGAPGGARSLASSAARPQPPGQAQPGPAAVISGSWTDNLHFA
jgi:hypothetical protein